MNRPNIILSAVALSVLSSNCLAQRQQTVKNAATHSPALTKRQQLTHAVIQDETDVVRKLLAEGGDANGRTSFATEDKWMLDTRPNNDPAQPLIVLACHFMSIKGPDIIQMLLDKGASVNAADRNGITPLMAASELGGAVSLVLEHKPNVNAADKTGKTALMYAMNNLGLSTTAHLLEHGAKINTQDSQGQTALMLAITGARHNPIRLISDDQKKKAEQEVIEYHDLIKFLIDNHADVSVKDKDGNTALAIAKTIKETQIVKMLEEAGAKS